MIIRYECDGCGMVFEWDAATISGMVRNIPRQLQTEGCPCGAHSMSLLPDSLITVIELEKEIEKWLG